MSTSRRRAHGSGNIRWRSGAWAVQVFAGRRPDGRLIYRHRTVHAPNTAAGLRKAEAVARNLYDTIKRSEAPPGSIQELIERYIDLQRDRWVPDAAHRNRQMLARHIYPALGAVPVDRLTTRDINDLYRDLGRRGLAPATVRRVHAYLHAALEVAVDEVPLERNPAHRAKVPAIPDPGPQRLPAPDALRRVIAAASPLLAVITTLAVHTGARTGELVGLRWADIDIDDAAVRILQTKTGRWKAIALGERTNLVVDRWRSRVAGQYEHIHGLEMPADWWVFPSPRNPGQPWRSTSVSHAWLGLRGGVLDGVAFKNLRKTMGTVCLTSGVDIRTVMGRGGWSASAAAPHAAVMLVHYAQFVSSADRAAAEIMDTWLWGDGSTPALDALVPPALPAPPTPG